MKEHMTTTTNEKCGCGGEEASGENAKGESSKAREASSKATKVTGKKAGTGALPQAPRARGSLPCFPQS
jgi:hypothetical protein